MKKILKRKFRMQVIMTAFLGSVTFILGSAVANAVTVYFNDADRGPADTLQVGDVSITLSGGVAGSQPVTVAGFGLGIANGLGFTGEIERQWHYPANINSPDEDTADGDLTLELGVSGIINSVTIVPFFRMFDGSGNLLPVGGSFYAFDYFHDWPPPVDPVTFINSSSIGSATTLTPTSGSTPLSPFNNAVDLSVIDSVSYFDTGLVDLRKQYLSEDITMQYGYTILSLDYTPVPEPGATTLLAAGLIGLLFAKQGRWSYRGKR